MPLRMEVATSEDGVTWTEAGTVANDVDVREEKAVKRDFVLSFAPRDARYVRVRAVNRGVCPPGHPGAGEECFVFADEIVVD